MPATKVNPSNLPSVEEAVPTKADTESPISFGPMPALRAAWQDSIREKLEKWLRQPSQLEDDGVEPPSGTIIRLALDYAERFRDQGMDPPTSIVPDANGGIVFERRDNDIAEVYHFWDDGTIEYRFFEGPRLMIRQPWCIT